jgi:sugar phosphate isomerase/epimerase
MFAFSTCWNTGRHTDGRALLAEVRALGFEYAELGHGTPLSMVDGIRAAVAAGEIKISSLHNFCPLPVGVTGPSPDRYRPSSLRESERQLAVRHTLRTIEFAASLGARMVVLHLGEIEMRDYTEKLMKLFANGKAKTPKFERVRLKAVMARANNRPKYFDQVLRSLDEIVPHARRAGVRLGLETRFCLEEIPSEYEVTELINRYGTDAVSYWHDVGHAQVKENFGITSHESLLERYRGRTAGMHLQDFSPPAFDHQPPGLGTFDFSRLTRYLTEDMILTWELHHNWSGEQVAAACRRAEGILRSPVQK